MSFYTIPLEPYPEQTFRLVLEGVPYNWRVYWTAYDSTIKEIIGENFEGCWYADIEGGDITIKGMALVTGCDLLGAFAFDQLGQLWLVDTETKPSDPTYESLGTNHQLVYVPLEDLIDAAV